MSVAKKPYTPLIMSFLLFINSSPNRPTIIPNSNLGNTDINGFTNNKSIGVAPRVEATYKLVKPKHRPVIVPPFKPNNKDAIITGIWRIVKDTTPI